MRVHSDELGGGAPKFKIKEVRAKSATGFPAQAVVFVSGKQLSRFCGLSPRNASSGERQADAGMIKAGRPQLRVVLIEAAHRLARYEPRWKDMATRLRRKGKPGSVVAAAIANRWMRWLFHQVQNPHLAA